MCVETWFATQVAAKIHVFIESLEKFKRKIPYEQEKPFENQVMRLRSKIAHHKMFCSQTKDEEKPKPMPINI